MKIGIVVDSLDDSKAGISTYTKNLVNNILKLDEKNDYVLIHHSKNDDPIFTKTEELIIPLKKVPFAREFRKILQMPKILEKHGFDLIHETTQIGPFFSKSKYKKIVTIHDLAAIVHPEYAHSKKAYLHHKIGLNMVLKNVDGVIAVSNSTKNDIMKYFKKSVNNISVILEAPAENYHGNFTQEEIDEVLLKYNISKPYLLYLGTIEPRKCNVSMIKAFNEIESNYTLVIGGQKGWRYDKIFEEIYKSKKRDKIVLPGFVDDGDVPKLFKGADAFIFPSLYEGFGIFVIEAMKVGCPVITSNVSSLPEVAGNAAILVDPNDVKEMIDAINNIKNPKVREKMIKEGFLQAEKFSWQKAAMETIKLYEEVGNTNNINNLSTKNLNEV